MYAHPDIYGRRTDGYLSYSTRAQSLGGLHIVAWNESSGNLLLVYVSDIEPS